VKNAQNYAIFAMRADTFDPIGDLYFKTGDEILLRASNGGYLNTYSYQGQVDYIAAQTSEDNVPKNTNCRFTVTVINPSEKTIKLQSWDHKYLNVRGDGYVMTDEQDFGDPCVFTVGECADRGGVFRLVLKAKNGKLWRQTDDNPPYVVATEDDVTDAHCLFQVGFGRQVPRGFPFLPTGQYLSSGDYLDSGDKQHFVLLQGDGNLCVYKGSGPENNQGFVWGSVQVGGYAPQPGSYFAIMQNDGNFCIFRGSDPSNNQGLVWGSVQDGGYALRQGSYFAIMKNDGNFCIYRGSDPSNNQGFVWGSVHRR
jgi:hypothetical protein